MWENKGIYLFADVDEKTSAESAELDSRPVGLGIKKNDVVLVAGISRKF
jgi:hypothetical protein